MQACVMERVKDKEAGISAFVFSIKNPENRPKLHKYVVDKTYQRPADAWSLEDNQCLIDTILRGKPMPMFFLNYISEQDVYYIVDGQQRLNTITKFYDNEIKINGRFSGGANNGKTFNKNNPISDSQRASFLLALGRHRHIICAVSRCLCRLHPAYRSGNGRQYAASVFRPACRFWIWMVLLYRGCRHRLLL